MAEKLDALWDALKSERCCVCLSSKKRPLCSPECLHGMCGRCSARHVWGSRSCGVVSCPLCRQRIRVLVPAEDVHARFQEPRIVCIEFAGVTFEICLEKNETVAGCLGYFFEIPRERMKVIAKGGKVVQDLETLLEAQEGKPARLIGTPKRAQIQSDAMKDVYTWALGVFEFFLFILGKLVVLLTLFFTSLMPSWANNTQHRRRTDQRAHVQ